MKVVQPIRDRLKLQLFKEEIKKRGNKYWIMVQIGLSTGLRISDILKLKVEDVQGTHIIIIEQKTKKPKRSFINDLFKRDLTEYIESEGLGEGDYLVYSNKKDENGEQRPISRVQAYKILKSVGNKVGISSIGTHTLRKTFGYHHYQQYKDVAVLQNIFNHSSPATTLRYIGINDDIMDKTIEQFYI